MTSICDESKKVWVRRQLKEIRHDNFERKAWYQADKFRSAWIWTCPKDYNKLNGKQFPAVAQTYFGDRQECMRGLEGESI
jgi:hypothetical protein